MKVKNYYRILGVSNREKSSGIRDAYRRLAKKHHPDKAGPGETSRFQEINEAYEVLSDPEKREDYNRRLLGENPGGWRRSGPSHFPGTDFYGGIESFVSELFGGLGVFYGRRRPYAEALDLEVLLSFEEAERGTGIDIEAPVFLACPRCGGIGRRGPFVCSGCEGEGIIERFEVFTLKLPPGVEDGNRFAVLLQRIGPLDRYLRIHVRVI